MEIRPIQGWRYAGQDVSKFIAPPYDILSGADKAALLAREARNIVAVDLPHVPPKEVGPDAEYQGAAELLGRWQSSGVLRRDARPAIYAYEQTFTWAGRTYRRRSMIAAVRATPLGQDVLPHEHTFAGPKADRLKLMQYTRMQLSPIFGFYDGEPEAIETLWRATERLTPVTGELNGVGERLWVIDDAAVIGEVAAALATLPVYIADGHHRYTTALNYRDGLKAAGAIDEQHEANFVMFVLVPGDDAGLLILPTHRIVRGLASDFSIEKLMSAEDEFDWRQVAVSDGQLADADGFLRTFGPTAMGFVDGQAGKIVIATLRGPEAMDEAAPEQLPAWRRLDVAILHRLIIDKALRMWATPEQSIDYTPDSASVLGACRGSGRPLGIFVQSTPLSSVSTIARAGSVMPHKSTYFYPKLATGMVLKPLE